MNRIMQAQIEYYAIKWARLPVAKKYKTVLQPSR